MQCTACYTRNLMGADDCTFCGFALCGLDGPAPLDRIEGSLMLDPVERLKPRQPITVPATTTVGTVMDLMVEAGVGAVLLTGHDGELVGILTERDFLTKIVGTPDFGIRPVSEFMSAAPEVVHPGDPLAFALAKMAAGGYRHIPVVRGNRPEGMVSVRDALRLIVQLCREG